MSTTATVSPLLARPGAVAAEGPDTGVAWHYGDPVAEQRALEAGAAVVDQSHLGIVTVTGPDRLTWLTSLATQDIAGLAPGDSAELMILSPQGRIEHVAGVVDDGETTWLITETAAALATFLERMKFMLRVEVADATARWAAIGEPVAEPLAGTVTWVDRWPEVAPGGTSYAPANAAAPAARPWRLTLVDRDHLEEQVNAREAAGATLAGTWAAEALRIAAHRPRAATEVDDTALPHELDWLRTAVHLHKGCFRGQETVAKVHNVGRPPRRLTMLHLDGSGADLPALGAPVTRQGDQATVGRVTSVSRHHELGPIALAVLKRAVDPSLTLSVAGEDGPIAASQEIVVNADGYSVDRPPPVGPTAKGLLMGKGCAADGGDMGA